MVMSRHQNAGPKHNIVTANKTFENVAGFKYFGTTVKITICIHRGIKSRLNSRNSCYRSV